MRRLRVLTWHIHGNHLLYLSQAQVDFWLPVKPGRIAGYGGRGTTFPFGANVHNVPADSVRDLELDVVLFQANVGGGRTAEQNEGLVQYPLLDARLLQALDAHVQRASCPAGFKE